MRIRSPVFVGRHNELARLRGWLGDSREGRPRVVIIGGEAGIGKTRLLEEFSGHAAEHDARWLIGYAADYGGGGLPFGAVAEALQPIASTYEDGRHRAHGTARIELAEFISQFSGIAAAEHADLAAPATTAPKPLPPLRVFQLLLDALERMSQERPVIFVLEDLHWADASTRDFLAYLARNLGTARMLVLGTYRSDDVGRRHPLRRYLSELERSGRIERLELTPFGRHELREQLRAIRETDVDDLLLDELYARSQGNPFFAEELVAAATAAASRGTVPPSLREMLLARVEGLSPSTRAVLAAAAVIGGADEEFLSRVTDLSQETVLNALREALDHHVLEPGEESSVGAYLFRHALVREAIYDDLLRGERVRLHQRVAEEMSAAGDGLSTDATMLAQLAHHWERAMRPNDAFVASWRAAEAAERAYAYPEAKLHYERVLTLWGEVDDARALLSDEMERAGESKSRADRAEVAIRAGGAARTAGDLGRSIVLLEEATAQVDPRVEPDRWALIHLYLMWNHLDLGDADASDEAKEQALRLVSACSPPTREQILEHVMGSLMTTDIDAAMELSLAALASSENGDAQYRGRAHARVGRASALLGQLDRGLVHFDAARRAAIEAGDDLLLAWVDKHEGTVLQCAARFEQAIEHLEASQAILRRFGHQNTVRHTEAEIAQALHRLGRWREAEEALEGALAPPAAEWGRVVRGYLLVGMGRLDEAGRELARAWKSVAKSHSSGSYGPYFAALSEKAIWEGRADAALEAASDALRYFEDNTVDLRWVGELSVLGIRAAADAEEAARAEELFATFRERALRGLGEGNLFEPELRASLASAEAEIRRARGMADPELYAKAAAAWHELKEPYPSAYALFRQAEALLERGAGRADAREPLRRSADLCREMGAAPLLAEAASLARRGRVDLGQVPEVESIAGSNYGLTRREREVLGLLARGSSDRQIAAALFISPKTASVHVSNIKGKLGVDHRIEVAAIGLRLGLADESSP